MRKIDREETLPIDGNSGDSIAGLGRLSNIDHSEKLQIVGKFLVWFSLVGSAFLFAFSGTEGFIHNVDIALFFLVIIGGMVYWRGMRGDYFHPLFVFNISALVFFGIMPLAQRSGVFMESTVPAFHHTFLCNERFIPAAYSLLTIGIALFILGYSSMATNRDNRHTVVLGAGVPAHPLPLIYLLSLGAFTALLFTARGPSVMSIPGWSGIVSDVTNLALAMLVANLTVLLTSRYRFTWRLVSAVFSVMLAAVLVQIYFDNKIMMSFVFVLAALYAIGLAGRRIRSPYLLAGLLVVVFVVFPVGFTGHPARPGSRSLDDVRQLYRQNYRRNPMLPSVYYSVYRFSSSFNVLTDIIANEEDQRPIRPTARFDIFYSWLVSQIPTAIYPEKSRAHEGQELGAVFFGFTDETKEAPTWIGDLLWRFGYIGVLLGMPILGLITCLVYNYFMRFNKVRWEWNLAYFLFIVKLTRIEAWTSSYLSGIMRLIIYLLLISVFVKSTAPGYHGKSLSGGTHAHG